MSMSLAVDLSQLIQMDALARVSLFANLSTAIADLAQTGGERWRQAIDAVPGIWDGERQAYKAAIRVEQTGPYAWVISNDYKYVEDIETGRPAYDMKRMLNTSSKVRMTKSGKRYLVIPFRHNTPGNTAHAAAMPNAIHAQARKLKPSKITGEGTRASGHGAYDISTRAPMQVRARKYAWGARLPAGLAPKLRTEHKTDPYAGMVRMSAGGGSTYMTFRVMHEDSSGWIVPAKPGLYIAKAVADSLERTAAVDIPEAVKRDVDAA